MTEAIRARDNETSTERMQRELEDSHIVDKGEGKSIEWHAGHETWDEAFKHRNEAPEALKKAGELVVEHGPVMAGEEVVKHTLAGTLKEMFAEAKTAAVAIGSSPWAPAVAGATALVAAVAEVVVANTRGDDLQKMSHVDKIDVGTTAVLDLDVGYKAAELAKYPSISAETIVTHMMTTESGRADIQAMQVAADGGSRAALDALRCGGRDEYFKVHPDAAQRLNDDVAFNKGFESVLFAASQRDGEARLKALQVKLELRDARSQSTIGVRG